MSTSKRILLIVVQGPTCSGKTTYAGFLKQQIEPYKNVVIMSTDDYFTSIDSLINEEGKHYDFDSPAHINWESLKSTLLSYGNREELISTREYSFITGKSTPRTIENTFPEVIILEGIYAFNLFNEMIFDMDKINPYVSASETPDDVLIPNKDLNLFHTLFKIPKILLDIDLNTLTSVRLHRDTLLREAQPEELDFIKIRVTDFIWPATQKWVLSPHNTFNYIIVGGSHNAKECAEVSSKLFKRYAISKMVDTQKQLQIYLNELL